MSTGNGTPGGGVRGLLAMFESQNQDSPLDNRGRSPSARSNNDTDRPLSRVRSNFIPVESLKKARVDTPEAGENGSRHRESFSTSGDPDGLADIVGDLKRNATQEMVSRHSNGSIPETLPEEPAEDPKNIEKKELPMDTGTITLPSITSTSVSRATSESQPEIQAPDDSSPIAKPVKEPVPTHVPEVLQPHSTVLSNLAQNLRTSKTAKSSAHKANEAPPSKDPALTPKEAATEAMPNGESTVQETGIETKAPNSPREKAHTSQQAHTTRAKPRVPSGTITTGGFVKPKPRSPTRPVRLPIHLIAPTASSAAKHGTTPPTQPSRTVSRRSSNVSLASRRPSTRNLNAPPVPKIDLDKVNPAPRSPTAAPASSFLQRMMRPTASSASKVKEKPVKSSHYSRS